MNSFSSWLRLSGESETEWGLQHLIAFVLLTLTLTPRTKQNARPDTEPEYYATKYQIQKCRVKIHYGSLKNKCGENDLEGHFIKKSMSTKLLFYLTRKWPKSVATSNYPIGP